jgi:RNA polymerase sigma-70 factor (ECF subfamily)
VPEVPDAFAAAPTPEWDLVEQLRAGDEVAFRELVTRYHGSLVRVARGYVPSRALAEEAAQETWLAVLDGIDRFEGRSSVKTWLFRILVNRAQVRGLRERRTVPDPALAGGEGGAPAVEPERFRGSEHQWSGHWASPPRRWDGVPEDRLVAAETRAVVDAAIEALPPAQREVIALRDVQGLSAAEVCELLDLSEGNQRVLLHRARSKVRAALERYLDGG